MLYIHKWISIKTLVSWRIINKFSGAGDVINIFWQKLASMHCYQFTGRWRIGSCDCWRYSLGISGRHLYVVVFAHLENFCHEHWNVGVILGVFLSSNTPMLRMLIVSALKSCFSWFISLRFTIQMIVVVDCTQLLSCFEGLVPDMEKKEISYYSYYSSWQLQF